MYKNLNPDALSINGRQSELIELTLTHGFQGVDLDLTQFQRQVDQHGLDHAARFFKSASIVIGPFDLPFDWLADDQEFGRAVEEHRGMLDTARALGSNACRVLVQTSDSARPYHANFEFHRRRIATLADILASYDIRLGIHFQAPHHLRSLQDHPFISTPDALVTLLKTADASNAGLVLDLWHWTVGGGSPDLLRGLTAEQIVEVRLADLPDNADLSSVTETDRLMPGSTGAVDVVPYWQLLDDIGFEGPVTPCPHPDQFSGQKREEVVRTAAAQTENFIKQPGPDSDGDGDSDAESDSLATARQ